LRVQFIEVGYVLVRGNHQVSGIIGVKIHDHESQLAAMKDQVGGVIIAVDRVTEDTSRIFLSQYVFDAPRRPDGPIHTASGSINKSVQNCE
jgi:hypothetical protein